MMLYHKGANADVSVWQSPRRGPSSRTKGHYITLVLLFVKILMNSWIAGFVRPLPGFWDLGSPEHRISNVLLIF